MTGWLEVIKALFLSITGVSKAVEVRTKPAEIQIDEHKEKKPLREQDFSQEMINDDFRYLKNRTEIDIDNYIRNVVHRKMENIDAYVKVVTERVHQYRYDNRNNFFLPKVVKWCKKNQDK